MFVQKSFGGGVVGVLLFDIFWTLFDVVGGLSCDVTLYCDLSGLG